MGVLIWIIVGVTAGFLTKLAMPGSKEEPSGFLGTMMLGIVGAVIGGWIWNLLVNRPGATGFDLGSLFVAFIGSVAVIGLMRLLDRQPTSY
ncbi:MAG: putative rane protein [Chthonomonadaceae bacterium]|nr:putative rane protein [Chthonomonadaceae bacterium]